jgi:hypothetical protein
MQKDKKAFWAEKKIGIFPQRSLITYSCSFHWRHWRSHYPAVVLARELLPRGFDIAMIGQLGGMEEKIALEEKLPFYGVHAGKIDRSKPNPLELIQAGKGLLEARAEETSRAHRITIPSSADVGNIKQLLGIMAKLVSV